LKFGDFDLDGFPDILMITVDVSGHRTPHLISNVPCKKNVPGCGESGDGGRGWALVQQGVDLLNEITDARGAAFLDVDEDVCLV
jgi:integrin alpha FG-GAP repeat containing protein 1